MDTTDTLWSFSAVNVQYKLRESALHYWQLASDLLTEAKLRSEYYVIYHYTKINKSKLEVRTQGKKLFNFKAIVASSVSTGQIWVNGWKKARVGKQSDGKSQAKEDKAGVGLYPIVWTVSPPHHHLRTPDCYCSHRHQDAIDRQDILFTTQSSRGWVWGLGSCRRQRSSPGQLQ